MAKAAWMRLNPVQLMMPGTGKFATMIMAVAAKKHVTVFSRSRRAPGAGSTKIKNVFIEAGHNTAGIFSRSERNLKIQEAMGRAGITGSFGPHYRRSKSIEHYGERIAIGAKSYGGVRRARAKETE